MITDEIWRPIVGYEGFYEVSNIGRIRSLDQHGIGTRGRKLFKQGRLIKSVTICRGYALVRLFFKGGRKHESLHRIMAKAFIPNPEGKPQVNHKNGIRTDNRLENLEWCTAEENMYHMFDVLKSRKKTPVIAINISTQEEKYFPSVYKASVALNTCDKNIRYVLKGIYSQTKGYKFKYAS